MRSPESTAELCPFGWRHWLKSSLSSLCFSQPCNLTAGLWLLSPAHAQTCHYSDPSRPVPGKVLIPTDVKREEKDEEDVLCEIQAGHPHPVASSKTHPGKRTAKDMSRVCYRRKREVVAARDRTSITEPRRRSAFLGLSYFILSLPYEVGTIFFSHQKRKQRLNSEIENFPQSPTLKKCQSQEDLIPVVCTHIHRMLLAHLLV